MRTITLFFSLSICAPLCSAADNQPSKHIITLCTLALMHQDLRINAIKYAEDPSKLQGIMEAGLTQWSKNKAREWRWSADNPDDMDAIKEMYTAGGGRISLSRR